MRSLPYQGGNVTSIGWQVTFCDPTGWAKKAEPQTRDHILLSNLNRFLRAWPTHCSKTEKVHETITFLLVTLPNIHRLKKFTHRLSNKPLLIWLLTTPLHLKYVATLPCNCFADINVSQGSVATRARCGGILNIHLNLAVKKILKLVKI